MRRFAFSLLTTLIAGTPAGADMASMMHDHASNQTCATLTLACAATTSPFITPDGTLWLVARADNRLFVTQSHDGAKSFASSVAIDTGTAMLDWGPDARPKIVVDPKGNVVVAYAIFRDDKFNGEVLTARSTDGGRAFSKPTPITEVQESQRFPALAFDSDGSLFAAWLDKRGRLAARATGSAYPGAGLAFAWSKDGGEIFGETRIARESTCECCRIAIAFAERGRPVILFRNIFEGGVRDHAVITFDTPDKPGPLYRVAADDWKIDACPHHGPSLAVAGDGSYHATWFTLGAARQGLFYANSRDGGATWSAPLPLAPAGEALSRPFVLAVGTTIRLAWEAFDGETTRIMTMVSHDSGVTWSPARVAAATTATPDHPILIERAGHALLSWQTGGGYRLISLDDAS